LHQRNHTTEEKKSKSPSRKTADRKINNGETVEPSICLNSSSPRVYRKQIGNCPTSSGDSDSIKSKSRHSSSDGVSKFKGKKRASLPEKTEEKEILVAPTNPTFSPEFRRSLVSCNPLILGTQFETDGSGDKKSSPSTSDEQTKSSTLQTRLKKSYLERRNEALTIFFQGLSINEPCQAFDLLSKIKAKYSEDCDGLIFFMLSVCCATKKDTKAAEKLSKQALEKVPRPVLTPSLWAREVIARILQLHTHLSLDGWVIVNNISLCVRSIHLVR